MQLVSVGDQNNSYTVHKNDNKTIRLVPNIGHVVVMKTRGSSVQYTYKQLCKLPEGRKVVIQTGTGRILCAVKH